MTDWLQQLERIDSSGVAIGFSDDSERLAALEIGEAVHRELRPQIGADYKGDLEKILREGLWLTQLVDCGRVRAVALWRVFRTTYCGRRLEIDDLVTAADSRSQGHGATMLAWLEERASAFGCPTVTLNSAFHRIDAHRFYEREGYSKIAFHFSKSVSYPRRPE